LGIRARRPESKGGAHEEKEKDESRFSMASPVTVIHVSTPPVYDFFPGHRQPPFNEITLISSSKEPPIGEKTRDSSPSVARRLNPLFAGVNFDNVTFISLSFPWFSAEILHNCLI
jgi:hypothetical protein